MRLASYTGAYGLLDKICSALIRWRLRGPYAHTEIVFEPGDGHDVAKLMPDGSLEPTDEGYWCASSVATGYMPPWSKRRAGKVGGVRFRRINMSPAEWDLLSVGFADPVYAAQWAYDNEGTPYDWDLILGYIAWFFPNQDDRVLCSEACAEMLGFPEAWRLDPVLLAIIVKRFAKDNDVVVPEPAAPTLVANPA